MARIDSIPTRRGPSPVASPVSRRRQVLGLGLAGLATGCALATPAPAQMTESPTPAFVEVTGTAQVSVPSDRSVVTFAVETEANSASDAAQMNADRMSGVLDALRGSRIEGLRVETFGYQLQPVYQSTREPGELPRIGGYRAINQVRATSSEVDRVGTLVDAAIEAGANRVTGLAFEASDTEPARMEALEAAVRNARAQAEAMARALGVGLGPVLEMRGGADRPSPPQPYLMRAEMAASTPVEAADQEVSASVTIRFALGGGEE